MKRQVTHIKYAGCSIESYYNVYKVYGRRLINATLIQWNVLVIVEIYNPFLLDDRVYTFLDGVIQLT